MPEASMYPDNYLLAREYRIRPAWQGGPMFLRAVAEPAQQTRHRLFRLGVSTANSAHVPAARARAHPVHASHRQVKGQVCDIARAFVWYGEAEVMERHRYCYGFNNEYRELLTGKGLVLSGLVRPEPGRDCGTEGPPVPRGRAVPSGVPIHADRGATLFRAFIVAALKWQKGPQTPNSRLESAILGLENVIRLTVQGFPAQRDIGMCSRRTKGPASDRLLHPVGRISPCPAEHG